ncbi:MAG: transporter [Pseudomonadales bacterium]|nr:transporter [Pseudomonadales bacterium]
MKSLLQRVGHKRVLPLLIIPLLALEVSAQEHNLTLGGFYSKGDYDQEEDTRLFYVPLSYDYTRNNWRFKATVPHLRITGTGNVLVNTGGVGRNDDVTETGVAEQTVSASGVGDILLGVSYQFPALFDKGPYLDVTAEIKLPTADEKKGLGTGEYDYGLQLDAYQLLGQTTLFATLGYRKRGDSDLFAELEDTVWGSLGLQRPLASSWVSANIPGQLSIGLIYDYREAASISSNETHELVPFLSWSPLPRWSFMTYIIEGFTSDSADRAAGVQLNYRW